MKFCTKCGSPILQDTKFCTKCGNPIKNINLVNEKSKKNEIDLSKHDDNTTLNDVKISKEDAAQSKQEAFKVNEDHLRSESIDESIGNNTDQNRGVNNSNVNSKSGDIGNRFINNENVNNRPTTNNERIKKQYINNKGENSRTRNTFFSGIVPIVMIAVVLIVAILVGVFFDRIRGEYYIIKSNNAVSITEKLEYAIKAVKVLDTSNTKDLLKTTIVEIAKSDVDLAEQKLEEASNMLSQGDFQKIAIGIKDKKIDKLFKDGKYQEAVTEFSEIDKLGGDFKSNKNYEDIMLNIISKITNTPVSNTKNLLMEDRKICFDNFDNDPFDEIIEVKANGNHSYNLGLKLNLYKLKNGQYKLADTEIVERGWNQNIQGVYDYATDKKGVFISYTNTSSNSGTNVYGIDNDKLQLKGAVLGNNYTKPDDADNDEIYEVLSNSTSILDSAKKDNSKWYKIYEDGRTPTEVKVSGGEKAKANANATSTDYIFKDSDKKYLTEDDIKSISKDQLALARNEIFARHGYVFNDEEFKKYFSAKNWYVSNSSYDGSDSTLNQYEIANYQLIQVWEKK